MKNGAEEERKEYADKRREAKKIIRNTREKWIEEEMVKIEEEGRNRNSKKFYQMINKRKNNNEITVNNIKNKAGQVTENEEQTKTAWMEHFKELLTETPRNPYIETNNRERK
ncbi:hypothetical protein QE152_g35974 [Popillia japonica]|uniref:Uncharacterized protein n=1 Tax=Popillia japonica TaxID=7064 RepID=A0AAW1IEH2_POPJA